MKLIGIDPDVEKNGVAVANGNKFTLLNLDLWDLRDLLIEEKSDLVIIEAGWLNKSNWHRNTKFSIGKNMEISRRTGENHATGKHIVSLCEKENIAYEVVKPLRSKLKQDQFCLYVECKKSNQEVRDAAMLVVRNRLYNHKNGIRIN